MTALLHRLRCYVQPCRMCSRWLRGQGRSGMCEGCVDEVLAWAAEAGVTLCWPLPEQPAKRQWTATDEQMAAQMQNAWPGLALDAAIHAAAGHSATDSEGGSGREATQQTKMATLDSRKRKE